MDLDNPSVTHRKLDLSGFGLVLCVRPKKQAESNFCTTQLRYRFILRIPHSLSVLNALFEILVTLGSRQ